MSQRRKYVLAACTAAVVMAVSACSSGGGASDDGSSAATGAASAASSAPSSAAPNGTGTPIKIGAICNCSGTAATGAAANAGQMFQAWVKHTNDNGGINGHPIQLDFRDDQSNPATSAQAAKALISAGVALILDNTTLSTTWVAAAGKAGIPVVGGYSTSAHYLTDENSYPSAGTSDSLIAGLIASAKVAGATKLGMFYCAEFPQCQEAVKPFADGAAAAGLHVVYSGGISATAPNFAAQCIAAKQAGVEALYIAASAETILRVAPDCTKQDYTGKFLTQGAGYALGFKDLADFHDRLIVPFNVAPLTDTDIAEVKTMTEAAEKYFPGMTKDPKLYAQTSVEAWAGGLLIAAAIEKLAPAADSTVTAKDVKGALDTFEAPDGLGDGFTPPIKFAAGKPHPISCYVIGEDKGGKMTLQNDGKYTCAS